MNSRERVRAIIAGEEADRCGFWLGSPDLSTWPQLHAYFKTSSEEELRRKLNDDFRHICPQWFESMYRHPQGKKLFELKVCHEAVGLLAYCENIDDVEAYNWPSPDYLNFDECVAQLKYAGDYYRASGLWTCFYHNVMDIFGMEHYFMKMHTHPEIVQAVTDKVCSFYYEANERFYQEAGDLIDGYFFGNDFGTQTDLICSPASFDQFILPWFKKFVEQAHCHGYQVILHSCGSIYKIIDRLIDIGVDCLHPLQAKAANMDAAMLAKHFKGQISFMGGIDTQELLIHATPDEIRQEVRRIRSLLGSRWIVSPSHETILANVPAENIEAMAQTAIESI